MKPEIARKIAMRGKNNATQRVNIKTIAKDENCDFLIIGAGYTGLSAARQLSQINSDFKIIIIDAQLAGEGASGRNSGYLVDTTLNDSYSFKRDIEAYKKKIKIYVVRKIINQS